MKPYIGVTGVMTPQESRTILHHFDTSFIDGSRELMVGVLVSSKTLVGKKNKYPNRYPDVDHVAGIFQKHHAAFNVIHYSTDERETLRYQLMMLADEVGGQHLHGFQLNMVWPAREALLDFRNATKKKYRMILQIGRQAMTDYEYDPVRIACKAALYENSIDAVLIDQSGGKGHQIENLNFVLDVIKALKELAPTIDIGVAGGLQSGTIHFMRPFLTTYPDLNWDAESGLRTDDDDLDILEVVDYLKASHF